MIRDRSASLALVALFLWLTGCSAYSRITPDQVAEHGSIRVTLRNGEQATIHGPRFEADSIVGWDDRNDELDLTLGAYSLSEVSRIEAPDPDGMSTGATILAIVVGLGLVTYAVAECESDGDCGLLDYLLDE